MIARPHTLLLASALSVACSPAFAHGDHAPLALSAHGLIHFLPWIVAASAASAAMITLRALNQPRRD